MHAASGQTPALLVLDDEALIAFALADRLSEQGYQVIGPCLSIEEARYEMSHRKPDIAVLDIDIDGQPVWPLANDLRNSGCNLIFVSANPDYDVLNRDFAGDPVLEKPASFQTIAEKIRAVEPSFN